MTTGRLPIPVFESDPLIRSPRPSYDAQPRSRRTVTNPAPAVIRSAKAPSTIAVVWSSPCALAPEDSAGIAPEPAETPVGSFLGAACGAEVTVRPLGPQAVLPICRLARE